MFSVHSLRPEINDEAREILRKIECLIVDVLTKLSDGQRLELIVRSRTDWSNCVFDDDMYDFCFFFNSTHFFSFTFSAFSYTLLPLSQAKCRRIRSTYTLALIFYLLAEIYEMISVNRTCTIR